MMGFEKSERGPARPDRPGGRSGFSRRRREVPMHRSVSREAAPYRATPFQVALRGIVTRQGMPKTRHWHNCCAGAVPPGSNGVSGLRKVCAGLCRKCARLVEYYYYYYSIR